MSLPPVAGHEELRGLLMDAATAGRLPQSVLIRGAPGIGKQRLALWLAAVIQCERQTGCGECPTWGASRRGDTEGRHGGATLRGDTEG